MIKKKKHEREEKTNGEQRNVSNGKEDGRLKEYRSRERSGGIESGEANKWKAKKNDGMNTERRVRQITDDMKAIGVTGCSL